MLEIKKKKGEKLTEGKILPKDDVTVYGTGVSRFMPAGSEHVVHSHLAKQLIADGKVVLELSDVPSAIEPNQTTEEFADEELVDQDADPAAEGAEKAQKGGKANAK